MPGDKGCTVLHADAKLIWQPPRSAAENLPLTGIRIRRHRRQPKPVVRGQLTYLRQLSLLAWKWYTAFGCAATAGVSAKVLPPPVIITF
jgi:hypothetical protein